jgi:acetyl esterase/lipase
MIDVCTSAADWVFEHGQGEFGARSVTMGGESAGAHLALCAALGLRDIRQDFDRLSGLVLFYGPYDLTGSDSARRAGPDTLILDGPRLVSGLERLTRGLGDDAGRHPRFSPLYANLEGLPPTMLLVGDRDPLLDDTLRLFDSISAVGGHAELIRAPEAPHAFNRFKTGMARTTNRRVREWLNDRHGS